MNDATIISFFISYTIFFFLFMFVGTFVHERVHLYTLRFFGGGGYIGKCNGLPSVIHTTTVVDYNQRIIVSLAPVPFDLTINFFAFYPLICWMFDVNWSSTLLCMVVSIIASLSGERYDIKKALETLKLKREGKSIPIPSGVNVVSMKKSK